MKPQRGTDQVIFKKPGERSLAIPIHENTKVQGDTLDQFAAQLGVED